MTAFDGFDPDAVALLASLPDFDAERYDGVREQLADGIRAPGVALIEAVAETTDADLSVSRRSSVSPLHTDLRFAKAGAPRYKDHLLLTTWEGSDKHSAPMLWIRIDSSSIGFASGIRFSPAVRQRWREAVAGQPGEALEAALATLKKVRRSCDVDVAGEQTKRVPKPWSDDHPRAELLRYTGFQARFREPLPKSMSTPKFVAWCVRRFDDLMPVHRWLVDELATKGATR